MTTEAAFPRKLKFLFEPARYKVAHGGRGSGKSWSYARALLLQGVQREERVLCVREVQKSIRDSVHRLLGDQIERLGLAAYYDVRQATIKGPHGTEFIFAGLSDLTADSIKSYEGVTKVWFEEAQSASERSWRILIPTIRRDGSEIWVTFNPELDTDPTWVRFVENTPPGAVVVQMNYNDNRWFPKELEDARAHDEATLPRHEYENIWEGKCLPAVSGAIYADEIAAAQSQGRVLDLPYDPSLKVHCIFDIGWNDKMSIIMAQKVLSRIAVIDYLEDDHKTYEWYSNRLRAKEYNWGSVWLPHDGKHKNAQTGKSDGDIMRELGWKVRFTPDHQVENGIRQARRGFAQTYFDRIKCERLLQCLKRYRRSVPATTGEPGAPMHDEWSHGADAFRYLHVAAPGMDNAIDDAPIEYPKVRYV